MLGVFAEFETNLRRQCQADGIAATKNKGIYKRQPHFISQEKTNSLIGLQKILKYLEVQFIR